MYTIMMVSMHQSLRAASLKMASAENGRENVHSKGCEWGEESPSAWVQLKDQPRVMSSQ